MTGTTLLPPKKNRSRGQRELLALFDRLPSTKRESLLDFARYLASADPTEGNPQDHQAAVELQQPRQIPRPAKESVVAAIRRLAQTYPMLNKDELLHKSSNLMGGHLLQGHPAAEVIDELEALFAQAYHRYSANHSSDNPG